MELPPGDLARTPAHVRPELVYDFDYFDPPGADDGIQLAWKHLQGSAPEIFWTPRNGGHWVATRGEDIREIQTNYQRYSQRIISLPPQRTPYKLLPVNLDPPEHGPIRRIIMPAFSASAIKRVDAEIRRLANDLVAELAPRGECEFIEDFARKLPIAVFLKMVNLPYEHREMLLGWSEASMRSRDLDIAREAQASLMHYLESWVTERRANPGSDMISLIVHARVGARPVTTEEIFSLLNVVLFGGLDTVTSMLGFICLFLARHGDHCRLLRESPELRPNAIEELLRCHGIVNTGRYITEDCSYKGVSFRAGDMIQVANVLLGLDDRINDDPLSVDFRRSPVRHAIFGTGPHVCPGALLTRREIGAFLDAWLDKIPEFGVKAGTRPKMAPGPVNGVARLELEWGLPD